MAVTVAAGWALTALMVNVWLVDPDGTMTVAGTVAVALLLTSVTVAPSVGAAAVRVIVPVTVPPPDTDVVDSDTLDSAATVVLGAVVELDPHPATDIHAASAMPRGTHL